MDGVDAFVEIGIRDAGDDAQIVWKGETITLLDTNHNLLDAYDFIFG